MRRVALLAPVPVLLVFLAACTADPLQRPWPDPDPDRPVVRLSYDVAEGHATVTGREEVTFVPDLDVCEVVLRAWPNKPATARAGNSMVVDRVEVEGVLLQHVVHAAGAPEGAPGTLVEVALPECRPAGAPVNVVVEFGLVLADGTDERLGRDAEEGVAWLGTAYPVLAWQREVGWVRDDAVDLVGETTTTETFELEVLEVTVPAGEEVAAVGERGTVRDAPGGRRTHSFTAPAVRDVAVTVGDLRVVDAQVAGTTVHLAAPAGTPTGLTSTWLGSVTAALTDLSALLGPVPYDHVWVSVLPGVSEGVEVGSAVQLARLRPGEDDWLVAHELAHLWFHGLVGNNQALHPWLDETLATYAQEVVRPVGWRTPGDARTDLLGASMAQWAVAPGGGETYVATVYTHGGALLTGLRAEAGEEALDEALRSYLRDRAHRVARPTDLREALRDLPEVDDALAEAGAWTTP